MTKPVVIVKRTLFLCHALKRVSEELAHHLRDDSLALADEMLYPLRLRMQVLYRQLDQAEEESTRVLNCLSELLRRSKPLHTLTTKNEVFVFAAATSTTQEEVKRIRKELVNVQKRRRRLGERIQKIRSEMTTIQNEKQAVVSAYFRQLRLLECPPKTEQAAPERSEAVSLPVLKT